MDKIVVSVVLPFYNAAKTLNRALESICEQSFIDFECILVNNNSTDESLNIAHEWVSKDSRFVLIHEAQQGVMFAFDTGAKIAQGRYIARMDADDWSYRDRLLLSYNFLEANIDYDVVAGKAWYVPHKENTSGFDSYVKWSNSILTYGQLYLNQFVEAPIINPTTMWRSEVGDQFGLYKKGDFPEDYEMWLRWFERGVRIKKIDSFFIQWNDSDLRLTRTDKIYSDEAFFRIKSSYLARWLKGNVHSQRKFYVWGASKVSRQRLNHLVEHGVVISGYIDVKTTRQVDLPVYHYLDLPKFPNAFVLVYVKPYEMRKKIVGYLTENQFVEGGDFLLVS